MNRIITPNNKLVLPMHIGMAGRFRFTRIHAKSGVVRQRTGWMNNLITDWGLNRKGTGGVGTFCHVGSGSNAPAVTDTVLQTWVASTNLNQSTNGGATGSAPYYGFVRRTYRFQEGDAAGNIAEVGIGPNGLSTSELFSRALVLDALGNPTTITVLIDEILDVEYELRQYSPTVDAEYTVVDSGSAVSHDITVRAASVNSASSWGGNTGIGALNVLNGGVRFNQQWIAYDGAIGSVTQLPSGNFTLISASQITEGAYSNNSLERTASANLQLEVGNLASGIRSLRFGSSVAGTYQAEFDPPIMKDNTQTLRIDAKVSWGRATI